MSDSAYCFGGGKAVTLEEVGLLNNVIQLAHTHKIEQVGERLEKQLMKEIKETDNSLLSGDTRRGYHFITVNYVLRISEVKTIYEVSIEKIDGYLVFNGFVDFIFSDTFADPLDIMQGITLTPEDILSFLHKIATAKKWDEETLKEIYKEIDKISPGQVPKWIREISELGGRPYLITGGWRTKIMGTLKQ